MTFFDSVLEVPLSAYGGLMQEAEDSVEKAISGDIVEERNIHKFLKAFYDTQLVTMNIKEPLINISGIGYDIQQLFENYMLSSEVEKAENLIKHYNFDGKSPVNDFKTLIKEHRALIHPFYSDFIRNKATKQDLKYYLIQETCLDPKFDDLLALMQVGLKGVVKMEIAHNYWDEMGNGNLEEMHTYLFGETLRALGVTNEDISNEICFESIRSGNLSSALCLSRKHVYKAIGYFGITEYLAPRRFKHVIEAWKRNSLPPAGIIYHDLHVSVDVGHANGWINNVIKPLCQQSNAIANEIFVGSAIRLNTSADYLDSLQETLITNGLNL